MTTSQPVEIRISAPGKVILHGEHAVVYGKAAIAATLNLRSHLTLKTRLDSMIQLELPDVNINEEFSVAALQEGLQSIDCGSVHDPIPASEEVISLIKKFAGIDIENNETRMLAIVAFLFIYYGIFKEKRELPAISVYIKSDLPVGAGLGSSAAFSVSLAAAILQFAGYIDSIKEAEGASTWSTSDKRKINNWAFLGEKVIHGRPSGIDNSISTYGGALRMQNGEITQLDKMPTLSVLLVNTKVPRSTMTLVAGVRQKYNLYPDVMEPIINAVEAITKRTEDLFKFSADTMSPDDVKTLGDLIDLNQNLLNAMGVGHPTLDRIVAAAKKHGFYSKLTGAGGGGCAFVLIPPDTSDSHLQYFNQDLNDQGFDVRWKTTVGGQGVLREL
ncbi:unnamed protein product [Lymnaea stagnalis]|uniref:Mevalonate kinase n=1 Tax=Lymnaea stagnalis TaxID=6523 RepID=A0AAV2HV51_LYMST